MEQLNGNWLDDWDNWNDIQTYTIVWMETDMEFPPVLDVLPRYGCSSVARYKTFLGRQKNHLSCHSLCLDMNGCPVMLLQTQNICFHISVSSGNQTWQWKIHHL